MSEQPTDAGVLVTATVGHRVEVGSVGDLAPWRRPAVKLAACLLVVVVGLAAAAYRVHIAMTTIPEGVALSSGMVIAEGGPGHVGQWELVGSATIDNLTDEPVTLRSVTLQLPPGWSLLEGARVWRVQDTQDFVFSWPQYAAGDPGDPSRIVSHPLDGTVCPPHGACPYSILTKVVPHEKGDFTFNGSVVVYELDGITYQQATTFHVDVNVK